MPGLFTLKIRRLRHHACRSDKLPNDSTGQLQTCPANNDQSQNIIVTSTAMASTRMLATPIIITTFFNQILAYPSVDDKRVAYSQWPSFDDQINEISSVFSSTCTLNVILTQEYEPLGQIHVPHKILRVNIFEGYPTELEYTGITLPLSRDVLHFDCLVTVILAAHGIRGPRWGKIYGADNGAWVAYLLTTGWQRHLKHPQYYVILSAEAYRTEKDWWQNFGLRNLERLFPTPGLETFFVLFYNMKGARSDTTMKPRGCRAYCYYCSSAELLDTDCATAAECLQLGTNMAEAQLDKGRNVKWLVLREDIKLGPAFNKSGFTTAPCHWPFFARRQGSHNECAVLSTQEAALSFSVSALNSTVLATKMGHYNDRKHRLPRIHWSTADSYYEDVATADVVYPLRIFPFDTSNQSQTSLKLITADGVRTKKPSVDLYLTPFDLASWTGTLVLLIIVTGTVIAVLTKQRGYDSTRRMLRRALFWISSALLEQPDDSNFSRSRTTSGVPSGLLMLALFMCSAVNNLYRAYLNVGYLTGNELETKWEEIKQVQDNASDFILYFALGNCAWETVENYHQNEVTDDRFMKVGLHYLELALARACADGCREPADGAICAFRTEYVKLSGLARDTYSPCWTALSHPLGIEQIFIGKQIKETAALCPSSRVQFLWKINPNFRYVPFRNLQKVIWDELTKPKTALVTTKDFLPHVWPEFENVMRANRSLLFHHNYHRREEDTSIPQDPTRLVIVSGLKLEYSKLVTDRAQILLSSGVWKFWDVQYRRVRRARVLAKVGVDAFGPLTMYHDAIQLLFVFLGALLAAGMAAFVGEVVVGFCRIAMVANILMYFFDWLL